MNSNPLASSANDDLAALCAQQANRVNPADTESSACYELFRRACTPPFDDVAWQSVYVQYARLVQYWLGQYTADDALQETFLRFFQAQKASLSPFTARYSDISAILAYLKRCAIAVRIATWRAEQQQDLAVRIIAAARISPAYSNDFSPGPTSAAASLKALVSARLKDEPERLVFELTYGGGLTPRDIQARYPEQFPTVQAVYRVRENLLKRLRRDAELQEWWEKMANDE